MQDVCLLFSRLFILSHLSHLLHYCNISFCFQLPITIIHLKTLNPLFYAMIYFMTYAELQTILRQSPSKKFICGAYKTLLPGKQLCVAETTVLHTDQWYPIVSFYFPLLPSAVSFSVQWTFLFLLQLSSYSA